MSEIIYFEGKVFLVFVLHGFFLLLCSDLLRSWRIAIPHGVWWTGVEDVCFWFAAGIWTFVLIFRYQDGILRLYMLAAAGIGMYVYRRTLSPWIIKGTAGALCLLLRLFRQIKHLISRLFQKIDTIRQKTIAKVVEKE